MSDPTTIGFFPFGENERVEFVQNEDGLVYPLTPCCGATAKGMDWYIGCRSCYEEVDSMLGACWTAEEWPEYHSALVAATK
jgi:hypothetical protein